MSGYLEKYWWRIHFGDKTETKFEIDGGMIANLENFAATSIADGSIEYKLRRGPGNEKSRRYR